MGVVHFSSFSSGATALQVTTSKVSSQSSARSRCTRSRLTLDIAGFREKRRLELVALAKDAIAEVVESGEPVRMAPMNAYERKVVHDEVAAAGLTSESEGEPPFRRVVVSKP